MLQIKPQYKGLIITRNLFNVGNVTLDTNQADPSTYKNFYDIGFDEFFEASPETEGPKYYTNIVHEEPVKELKIKKQRKKKDGK